MFESASLLIEYDLEQVRTSVVAHIVKNLPAMQETQVQSLGWEDPLGSEESDMTEGLTLGTKEV